MDIGRACNGKRTYGMTRLENHAVVIVLFEIVYISATRNLGYMVEILPFRIFRLTGYGQTLSVITSRFVGLKNTRTRRCEYCSCHQER